MGNCVRKEATMLWGGEDWGSLASDQRSKKIEEKGLLKGTFSASSSSSTSSTERTRITEVKVKITKKQLEELLGKTDIQGLSVEQVLGKLMKVSAGYESHQRSWRPALQSIPETN